VKKITRGCWQIHVWGEAPQAPRGVVCTTVVLYNAETWTLKQEHQRKLRVFEVAVLRRICGVPRRDRKRNIDIICVGHRRRRSRAASETETNVFWTRFSYAERYPHTLLHGHISGSRPQGRPRKKWIGNVKEDCNRLKLTLTEAARAAHDRHQRRGASYATWAATARGLHLRRQGIKSSASPQ